MSQSCGNACELTSAKTHEGRSDSKMPVTLQSPLQNQAVARLILARPRSLPSLASPSACCQLCPGNTFLITICNESSSQDVILGDLDQGHKHYSYSVPALKELSA